MGAFGRRCPFDLSAVAQASEEMMAAGGTHEKNRTVEELLEEALVDAYGDDEQLWALRQAFEDDLKLPADAFVIGEPVSIVEFDYDGNERRGLTAKCRRDDGSEHVAVSSQPEMPNRAKQCCQDAPGADDRVAPETGAARSAARAAGRGQSKRSSVTMLEEPMILVSLAAACRMER